MIGTLQITINYVSFFSICWVHAVDPINQDDVYAIHALQKQDGCFDNGLVTREV